MQVKRNDRWNCVFDVSVLFASKKFSWSTLRALIKKSTWFVLGFRIRSPAIQWPYVSACVCIVWQTFLAYFRQVERVSDHITRREANNKNNNNDKPNMNNNSYGKRNIPNRRGGKKGLTQKRVHLCKPFGERMCVCVCVCRFNILNDVESSKYLKHKYCFRAFLLLPLQSFSSYSLILPILHYHSVNRIAFSSFTYANGFDVWRSNSSVGLTYFCDITKSTKNRFNSICVVCACKLLFLV